VHPPGMIGEPGRHRGRALLPLAAGAHGREPAEAVVWPAEVVGAADQIHPRGQRVGLVGDGSTPPHQRGERAAKGRVEALDVRGVDAVAGGRRRQHGRDRGRRPLHDARLHTDDPSLDVLLDHLAQQEAGGQHQPWAAAPPCVDWGAEHPPEGRDVAGQAIDAHEQVEPAGTGADLGHQAGDQDQIPLRADRAAQPQPGGHGQGQRHPHPLAHQLHPQLVGLHVLQVELPLLHQVGVDRPAVRPGSREPGRHGTFIEPEGRDNRLRWTAMAQQGQHERHLVGRAAQPVEGRARRGREGPPARVADIALLRLAMHADVALPHLPSGRAAGVVTELLPRVHAAPPVGRVSETRQPEHASVDPPFHPQPRLRGVVPQLVYLHKKLPFHTLHYY